MTQTSSVGIRLRNVSAVFPHADRGAVTAVRDIDLDVRAGELLTLLGPSGCGKTTTLRMIAGFQDPSSGTILIGDRDVTLTPANRRDIGFVFQSYALFPHLTVFENVAYGLRVRRKPRGEVQKAVAEVLSMVGLDGFSQRLPSELSGGQQQRVAVARAIVIRPRVLLFDEPLSNLDAKLRVDMRTEIQRLQRTLGITTVYVTHDQEEAMAISDRIAVMADGRIAQLGTAEDLYRRPVSAFVARFLGRTNILPGIVRQCSRGRITLDLLGAPVEIASTAEYAIGTWIGVVIRPEAIVMRTDGHGLDAEVMSRVYLGDKVDYVVRANDRMINVVHSNPSETENFTPGRRVCLILPTDGLQLLAEDD